MKLPSFIHVDKHHLDKEWEELSATYMKYCLKVADAQDTLAEIEAEAELCFAELDAKIRKKPLSFGFKEVPKEAGIKSCILQQQRYKDNLKSLNEAKHSLRVFQAAVKGLEMKQKALENISWLDSRGYFVRVGLPKKAKQ